MFLMDSQNRIIKNYWVTYIRIRGNKDWEIVEPFTIQHVNNFDRYISYKAFLEMLLK